jgi:guanidinoacetate N-methyltransferase
MTDTVQSRIDIGFPSVKQEWTESPAYYDEHTLRIAGHPVMEDWELGYMKTLAGIAGRGNDSVLELGYGLGLSAAAVQSWKPRSHVVVECHPDVIAKCLVDQREAVAASRLHVISGFWQDVVAQLRDESFDGILFDAYPMSADAVHKNHFEFFTTARRLLRPGGRFTYYSDEVSKFSAEHLDALRSAGFVDAEIDSLVCEMQPPKDCEYWTAPTMLAPIITKL